LAVNWVWTLTSLRLEIARKPERFEFFFNRLQPNDFFYSHIK